MKIEFSRNNEQEKGFKELLGRFDEAERLMKPSAGQTALSDLDRLRDAFRRRVETFRRVDRKLSIAVVGRVKAGKSSFLNSLLFDGKDVLPARSPPRPRHSRKSSTRLRTPLRLSTTRRRSGPVSAASRSRAARAMTSWRRRTLSEAPGRAASMSGATLRRGMSA